MKKYIIPLLSSATMAAFAKGIPTRKMSGFGNAPWCHMPCGRIQLIIWSTLLGTIALQVVMLLLLPRMKKLKKWQKYTLYGIITVASIATAARILPPYLQDGFVIGRCFMCDPMGCN
ncbi:MAG: hypothetical protein WCK88_04645 [bacterium]